MQLDNKNMTDLEYLAGLGFEKTPCNDSDINELKAKVSARSFSYNSGSYFTFISLISGIFLGISAFFKVYTPPLSHTKFQKEAFQSTANKNNGEPAKLATVILDTVNIVKENFVRTANIHLPAKKLTDTLHNEVAVAGHDSAYIIPSLPIELPALKTEKISEPEIKYIPNSPIIYLHDLKITDYSSLYFKKNKFINLRIRESLNAAYSNKEDYTKYDNVLEPTDNYYLHDVIKEAMLHFKNQNYNVCIKSLNTVAQFTGNDINCRFYYGMCNFYKKNYTEALKNLEDCISNPNNSFLQEAEYYKALCLSELGNKAKAQELFKRIAEDGGFYAEKAKRFL